MPNCLGSLDGKHIKMRKPACTGSKFFNYKHTFSIVLLALADAHYKFLFCDIGSQGRCSDAGVYAESDLRKALDSNVLNIPEEAPLPGTDEKFPFFVVADDAFPLQEHILKPYPHRNMDHDEQIYNYRVSRARRCVESAFGIMANRFRVLLNPICLDPKKVDVIVLACCVMHNMLRTIMPNQYVHQADGGIDQGRVQLGPARVDGRRSATNRGKALRDSLRTYFMSPEGAVPWQEQMIK